MAVISLKKNETVIDLVKKNPGLKTLMVGLAWDPIGQKKQPKEQKPKGFLGRLFGGGQEEDSAPVSEYDFDADASVILYDANNKHVETVYFGNKESSNKSIVHGGDNLTGEGEGDDEVIMVNLNNVPEKVNKLVFVVNIYQGHKRNQDFSMVENARIRLLNNDNQSELARYNLTDDYQGKQAIYVGEVVRSNGDWSFKALGVGGTEHEIEEMVRNYPSLGL